ncbi:MAG: uracil-DNA glycosylase [Candidatus Marinimicrobia bacterium]|nr:uracil-DNA glycosylase [Candidatus Neomarinimicrobiota bacterium]MBL7023255.1 uracil-DNA glycosylase [Candidatus Neomarinimicrobiota bacterium]MBL7108849.1 uracil-DNA glycosylase [Candidatus Neomarinimicrobiota bacterium]
MSSYLEQTKDLLGDKLYLSKDISDIEAESNSSEVSSSLVEYSNQISDCEKCSLHSIRTNFVFGVGNPSADIVFVGEAPGKQEDLLGEPFVGRAGKLLDKIIAAINLTRDDIYICNVLKCRPPDNRNPNTSEVEQCEPYLKTQLKIIEPKLIVALGRVAAKTLLKVDLPLGEMRKQSYSYEGIDAIVTYHPAALLRNPAFKRPCWEDFQKIRDNYLNKG